MVEVRVGWDFERALKAFTKRVKDSGLAKDLRLRSFFESRSQRRRRKHREAVRRMERKERRYERFEGMA